MCFAPFSMDKIVYVIVPFNDSNKTQTLQMEMLPPFQGIPGHKKSHANQGQYFYTNEYFQRNKTHASYDLQQV